jgi:hypothetical protein
MAKSQRGESIPPQISAGRAIQLIRQQIARLDSEIINLDRHDAKVDGWKSTTEGILHAAFGKPNGLPDRRTTEFLYAQSGMPHYVGMDDSQWQEDYVLVQKKRRALLESYVEQLEMLAPSESVDIGAGVAGFATGAAAGAAARGGGPSALDVVESICRRFHLVARQLRSRHGGRPTFEIEDEYDVQDLLHSLLRLGFDDIRPEEWTPSYASSSARMDFLLKEERIVVEVKMARPGRDNKKIAEELIVDAARYRGHPDCRILVCMIYDPEGVVPNPRGVEADLNRLSDRQLRVVAIIVP